MVVGAAELEAVSDAVSAPEKLLDPVATADGEPPRVAVGTPVAVA